MSRPGSLILQEHWSDPLCCCVLLCFSVATPGICCLENVGQLLRVNGKKKKNLLREQTRPLRLVWGHVRPIAQADKA